MPAGTFQIDHIDVILPALIVFHRDKHTGIRTHSFKTAFLSAARTDKQSWIKMVMDVVDQLDIRKFQKI